MSTPLRIGIDVAALRRSESGIGRYTESLVVALAAEYPHDELIAFFAGPGSGVLPLPDSVRLARMRAPRRLLDWSWRRLGWPPTDAATGGVDVFHTSDWSHPPQRSGATVTTVHDLGPLDHPEWYTPAIVEAHRRQNRRTAERAHRIIAISAFTRERLLAHYDVEPARVVVVPNGAWSPPPSQDSLERLHLPERFLLYVGTAEARKNLPGLVRIFRRVAEQDRSIGLVLAGVTDRASAADVDGSGAWTLDVTEGAALDSATRGRIRSLGPVDRTVLGSLYERATAFVFPTLYEGFGLPLLEAMAAGCPVVASDRSAVPEVVGEAGVLADPADEDGFARAVLELAGDSARADVLTRAGRSRAAAFTWERTARETRAVYEDAAAVAGPVR